jgi:hypothetical protein
MATAIELLATDAIAEVTGLRELTEICELTAEPAPMLTRLPPPAVWMTPTLVLPTPTPTK